MSTSEIIARNILALAKKRDESIFQIATGAGLGRSAIDDIIKGNSQSPRLATLEKIAKYLGVSIHSLLEERGDDELRNAIIEAVHALPDDKRELAARLVRAFSEEDEPALTS